MLEQVMSRIRSNRSYQPNSNPDLSWQHAIQRPAASRFGYVQDNSVRRERMTLQADLPGRGGNMRPEAMAAPRVRRTELQAQEEERIRREAVPMFSRQGVRASTAMVLLVVVSLTLLALWSGNRSQVRAAQARISLIERRITSVTQDCFTVEERCREAAAKIDVGYQAVNQGMISAKGARKVYLTIPSNVISTPFSATVAQQEELVAASISR